MLTASRSRSILLALIFLSSTLIVIESDSISEPVEAASGIDVHPVSFDITYVNSADQTTYRLLSSHDPSDGGFNRPVSLYLIDAMVNVSSTISVTVQNSGTTASGAFTMRLVILHNEYSGFEIYNQTVNVGSISGGSSTTATATVSPRYGGNHTLVATTLIANDDNRGNDALSKSFAVGQVYDNCDTQGGWTFSSGWQTDSAVSLVNSAFNVGSGGTSSSYGASWDRSLTSPNFDFSNAHDNPNTYAKLGFFYTGSAGNGDGVRIEWWDGSTSSWVNTVNNGFSFDGVVDADLTDGTSWLIQNELNRPGGSQRPGFNIPTSVLNSATKFRFRFISDASDNGAGYWIEDVVLLYEEKAWPEEFGVSMSKGVDGHARRGHWADHVVTVQNDGNLTDYYRPSVSGLPADWDYQFVHMSGSTILPSMDIELGPGESISFKVQIKPGASATVGSHAATASISSTLEPSTGASVTITTLVDPDYIPAWDVIPQTHYCLPGTSCEFSINLTNIGDGSDTFSVSATPVVQWTNWTFDISYNQPPTVTIPPGSSAIVQLQADIPNTALPGQTASIDVTATSQADLSVTATIRVNLTASMISNAGVGVNPVDIPASGWWVEPGDSLTIPFTVWNNASSQDSFAFSLDNSNLRGWNATVASNPNLVIRSGEAAKVQVEVIAPSNAQAGDPAPILTPIVTSVLSGSTALANPYGGIRVTMLHDLVLRNLSTHEFVTPGFPEAVTFEVENRGNGPDYATVTVNGIPSTWMYHIEVGGSEQFGPISLSPSYEGNHIVQFQVVFTPPGGEEANLQVDLSVSVAPESGIDLNESDNSYDFSLHTERVTRPVLTIDTEKLDVRTDSLHLVQLTLINDGNAVDGDMRIRISSDSMHLGIFSTLSNGGQVTNLDQWMDTPLPPQQELHLEWLISVAFDVPVGTQVTFSVNVEASPDNQGNSQDINESLTLTVASHRELQFSHSLTNGEEVEPGRRMLFKVNATSFSSFTEEMELKVYGGEEWSVICNNIESDNHRWMLVAPATNDPTCRQIASDCELTAPSRDSTTPLAFSILVENQSVWSSTAAISFTTPVEEPGGYFFAFGDVEQNLPLIIGMAALVFLIFVGVMVIAINRKRRSIDEYDDEEDEEPVSVSHTNQPQKQHPTPQSSIVQVPQHPTHAPHHPPMHTMSAQSGWPQPQHAVVGPAEQSGITDDQYRAAGWSEEKIADLRRQQQREAAEWASQQAAQAQQQAYSAQMQMPSPHQSVTPHTAIHLQPTVAPQPIQQTSPPHHNQHPVSHTPSLDSAFGSLGVTEHQPAATDAGSGEGDRAGATAPLDKDAAFAALGAPMSADDAADSVEATANTIEPQDGIPPPDSADETVESERVDRGVEESTDSGTLIETNSSEPAGSATETEATQSIPVVACAYCNKNLGPDDRWLECDDCGIYSHGECQEGEKTCARCGASL